MQFVITVPSSDKSQTYELRKHGKSWSCTCKGYQYHSKGEAYTCRHIAHLASSLFVHVANSALSGQAKDKLSLITKP